MRRIDQFIHRMDGIKVGELIDIGWGLMVLNADDTVTRACKGCGAAVRTPIVRNGDGSAGKVVEAEVNHRLGCPVSLGNNPIWS